jgi:hypothetical protein
MVLSGTIAIVPEGLNPLSVHSLTVHTLR